MATQKLTFEIAGKNGQCAGCYGRIQRGSMEHRYFDGGRRFRYHPDCARKTGELRVLLPAFYRGR